MKNVLGAAEESLLSVHFSNIFSCCSLSLAFENQSL